MCARAFLRFDRRAKVALGAHGARSLSGAPGASRMHSILRRGPSLALGSLRAPRRAGRACNQAGVGGSEPDAPFFRTPWRRGGSGVRVAYLFVETFSFVLRTTERSLLEVALGPGRPPQGWRKRIHPSPKGVNIGAFGARLPASVSHLPRAGTPAWLRARRRSRGERPHSSTRPSGVDAGSAYIRFQRWRSWPTTAAPPTTQPIT